jgi:hypothetical protein
MTKVYWLRLSTNGRVILGAEPIEEIDEFIMAPIIFFG